MLGGLQEPLDTAGCMSTLSPNIPAPPPCPALQPDTPIPSPSLPYRHWGSHTSWHPSEPTCSKEASDRRADPQACRRARPGLLTQKRGPLSPQVTQAPAPASRRRGPALRRRHLKKAWTPVPSTPVLLKNSSIGGWAGRGTLLPAPPVAHTRTGSLGPSPQPCSLSPLDAVHGPSGPSRGLFGTSWDVRTDASVLGSQTVNTVSETSHHDTFWALPAQGHRVHGSRGQTNLISATLAECHCPCHPPHTARELGKSSSWSPPFTQAIRHPWPGRKER